MLGADLQSSPYPTISGFAIPLASAFNRSISWASEMPRLLLTGQITNLARARAFATMTQ